MSFFSTTIYIFNANNKNWEVKIMKKILFFLLSSLCIISLCLLSVVAENQTYSWYCVRNKDHKQPQAESEMSFIEEYGGYYVDKKHGDDSEDKVIYLTFDAGYENGNVQKILNVLKQENVPAAFFILDNFIIRNKDLVIRMIDEGHTVCNHTSKHPDVTKYNNIDDFKAELENLESTYEKYTGKKMSKYFRPPEGKFSEQSMKYASELGYKTIFWSFAYADWDNAHQMSAVKAKEKILSNLHNGEILLLHPTSATNAAILSDIIKEIRGKGFRFASLDELI